MKTKSLRHSRAAPDDRVNGPDPQRDVAVLEIWEEQRKCFVTVRCNDGGQTTERKGSAYGNKICTEDFGS